MRVHSEFFFAIFRFLIPPTLIGLAYLYLYPVLQQCEFPVATSAEAACYKDGTSGVAATVAPFRLLALADPQLEGDTSIPTLSSQAWSQRLAEKGVTAVVKEDVTRVLQRWRKKVDLWGNDLYLAHIYRMVRWWTDPTHTVVLGDLLGSQWIGDEEFSRRSDRFWNTVFSSSTKVPYNITDVYGHVEVLGADKAWRNRIIAIAGNHDVGYAGDVDDHRIKRFEGAFGAADWDIRFRLPSNVSQKPSFANPFAVPDPELHLVILNSMTLDSPILHPSLRERTLQNLEEIMHDHHNFLVPKPKNAATILLTHVPLHKEAGICVDPPYFSYFPDDQGGGIREQNHLSEDTSAFLLNELLPLDGKGSAIVLNGHDHEGCDTFHSRSVLSSGDKLEDWTAARFQSARARVAKESHVGLREVTVRSMMGSFGGNAGLLSVWFDESAGEWKFEYDSCMLGVQHIWWAGHVLALVELGLGAAGMILWLLERKADASAARKTKSA
ncbi:hypothetical protein LTS10_009345 [Elasticomyces elasticus]|nr:hypothetical protein LTS10_009345 [Elasticomyces elasticus]